MAIEMVASLYDYFHENLQQTVREMKAPLGAPTVDYLANLLEQFAVGRPDLRAGDSLVLSLDQTLSTNEGQSFVGLQAIGDRALCTVSFLSDQMQKIGVSQDLYLNIGMFAYRQATHLMAGHTDGSMPVVLVELTERFPLVVDVMSEIAESAALGGLTRDLVRQFDRWKSKQSVAALKNLAQQGVFPTLSRNDRGVG